MGKIKNEKIARLRQCSADIVVDKAENEKRGKKDHR